MRQDEESSSVLINAKLKNSNLCEDERAHLVLADSAGHTCTRRSGTGERRVSATERMKRKIRLKMKK